MHAQPRINAFYVKQKNNINETQTLNETYKKKTGLDMLYCLVICVLCYVSF